MTEADTRTAPPVRTEAGARAIQELKRIGVVRGQTIAQSTIADILSCGGYICTGVRGRLGLSRTLPYETFDLFILEDDGEAAASDLVGSIRAASAATPIVVVCDAASEARIAEDLDAGADAVLIQPSAAILLAQVRAILRRTSPAPKTKDEWNVAAYAIHAAKRSISLHGQAVQLSRREFELAEFLFANPGRKLSRSYISEAIWGRDSSILGRSLDTHISRIRAKLKLEPANGVRLTSLYGYGYQLELLDHEVKACDAEPLRRPG